MHSVAEKAPTYRFDIPGEKLIDLIAAGKALARITGRQRPVHKSQLRRWANQGARGQCLPTLMVAGKRYTSIAAIRWWIAATTAAAAPAAQPRVAADAPCLTSQPQELGTLQRTGIATRGEA